MRSCLVVYYFFVQKSHSNQNKGDSAIKLFALQIHVKVALFDSQHCNKGRLAYKKPSNSTTYRHSIHTSHLSATSKTSIHHIKANTLHSSTTFLILALSLRLVSGEILAVPADPVQILTLTKGQLAPMRIQDEHATVTATEPYGESLTTRPLQLLHNRTSVLMVTKARLAPVRVDLTVWFWGSVFVFCYSAAMLDRRDTHYS